jgi:hypothetical protein
MSAVAVDEVTTATVDEVSAATVDEVTELVRRATALPANLRITLARRVLESLELTSPPNRESSKTLKDLVGLVKLEGPPPSDEECQKILEEERFRRYGQ